HLVVRDLAQQSAANSEVRVAQAGTAGGQPPGEPVGPAAVAAAVGVRVTDAFGEAVAQRDERAGSRHRVPHSPQASRAVPAAAPGGLDSVLAWTSESVFPLRSRTSRAGCSWTGPCAPRRRGSAASAPWAGWCTRTMTT